MERIVIIGCPGSGKTTLSRALGEKLNLPVVHLDRLWWSRGWENVTREEFDARLENALNMEHWIIEGNYSRTLEARLKRCDTVIYLDYSRWICLWGFFQRLLTRKGTARPDLPEGCPEKLEWDFLKYIWYFNEYNRVMNYTQIAKAKHANAIVLKSRKDAQKYLQKL